jgi:kinesin family member C1
VRPPLSSELEGKEPLNVLAAIEYPDGKEQREIQLSSVSESATGRERKENWNFAFDRVGVENHQ